MQLESDGEGVTDTILDLGHSVSSIVPIAFIVFCFQEPRMRGKQKNYDAEKLITLVGGVLNSYGTCKLYKASKKIIKLRFLKMLSI